MLTSLADVWNASTCRCRHVIRFVGMSALNYDVVKILSKWTQSLPQYILLLFLKTRQVYISNLSKQKMCRAHCANHFRICLTGQDKICSNLIVFNSVSDWLIWKKSLKFCLGGHGSCSRTVTVTVHGLIFGRVYYWKDICIWDLGGLFSGGLIFSGGLLLEFYGNSSQIELIRSSKFSTHSVSFLVPFVLSPSQIDFWLVESTIAQTTRDNSSQFESIESIRPSFLPTLFAFLHCFFVSLSQIDCWLIISTKAQTIQVNSIGIVTPLNESTWFVCIGQPSLIWLFIFSGND